MVALENKQSKENITAIDLVEDEILSEPSQVAMKSSVKIPNKVLTQ